MLVNIRSFTIVTYGHCTFGYFSDPLKRCFPPKLEYPSETYNQPTQRIYISSFPQTGTETVLIADTGEAMSMPVDMSVRDGSTSAIRCLRMKIALGRCTC